MYRVFRALWPMVLWMGVVFLASTDLGAESNSSRILVPILRWLDPGISTAAIEHIHLLVRKAGHVIEYAVLAIFIFRALRILRPSRIAGWSWPLALGALGVSAAYGATDEIHQLFVPTRGPSVHDVLIDSGGAVLGLFVAYLWTRNEVEAACDRVE